MGISTMLYAGGNKVMYCVLHTITDRRWIGIESVISTSMKISAARPPRPPLNRRYEDQPATAAVKILGNKESRYQVSSTYQPQPTHATTFRPIMG